MTVNAYGNFGPGIRANDVVTARLLRYGLGSFGEQWDIEDFFDYPDGEFVDVADPPWDNYTTCADTGPEIVNGLMIWPSENRRTMWRNFDNMVDVQDILVEMVLSGISKTGTLGEPRPVGGPAARCRQGTNVTGSYQCAIRYNGTQFPNQIRIIRQGVGIATCPSDNVLTTVNMGERETGRFAIQAVGITPTTLTAFLNGQAVSNTTDSEAQLQQSRRAGWVWNGVTSSGGLEGNALNWSVWRARFL